MGAPDNGAASATISTTGRRRLKREDYRRTKHDSAFSHWKILIGPSDWEDHAQGKEGAERYRVGNLPNCSSCPGVYELGIVESCHRSGREASKLDPNFIIPVYLGKSDNARNRLQQYGREGAHLENGSSYWKQNYCNNVQAQEGLGLFSEIFAKGFSIVYRWAPMTNSRDAEKTEAELLDTFDYAWNKDSNGPRRRNDILRRIYRSSSIPQFLQKFQFFPQRPKGIKIKACQPPFLEDRYNLYTNFPPNNILARVLKFGRSRPILVPWKSGIDEDNPSICGVALGHGIVCRKPPSEGRKRCAEHKGMKINATSSNLLAEGKFTLAAEKQIFEKDITLACGVILADGTSCTTEPVQGNKRCLEHKGRKVRYNCPQSVQVKEEYFQSPKLQYDNNQDIFQRKDGRPNGFLGEKISNKNGNAICGVKLGHGTFCTRQPRVGRKRCEEHKGMRVKKEAGSRCFTEETPCAFDSSGAKSYSSEEKKNHPFLPSLFSDKSSATCKLDYHNTNSRCSPYGSLNEDSSPFCGAPLRNGSYCRRRSNGRCWQHRDSRT
ncbi:hypothetical protein M9H77_23990 [Catharanthus roseus]|uniref:Uncharacterized protein n=1 Tax=Catharanthus roseus TaxID=4058 RepID=A0ACC0AXD5_CATRO|nr:hypothetical protein M9H77_23990 [Catharanthus roseus]